MNRVKWFFHPVLIFILSITALAASLFLYIYWYIEVSTGLQRIIKKYNLDPSQFLEIKTWVVILVLSILVGLILTGVFTIFVYNEKTWRLYRMQRNFINNFTHELKTPVASLRLYLDTFAKYELPREDQLRYLDFMIHDVNRLLENINRILDLARIEGKSYQKDFTHVDIIENIEEFCAKNADLFRGCEIAIHNPLKKAYFYWLNLPLFDMLLMNLCTNAIKYNQSDQPRIDIRFVPHKKGIDVRFEDNGMGIEKGETKKIFRKFYQVGQTDDMTAKGTGLGLYLVEQIALLHRAGMTAESEGQGKGAAFILHLPRPAGKA
ncbi:MAG: HAMP domain-containing histidine kinase [Syntrophales bacterium]|jgi:signal transduction histidine kinase|nr:HAMP domain-containing histidine kinase [Syntrophales bacterium]MCK9392457.1 HAMP domain-containing histidine kinase [Syntrophales bacterium]